MRPTWTLTLAVALATCVAPTARAEHVDLPLVPTAAEHIRCLFSPSCTPVPSTTTIQTFTVPGAAGEGRLEVRTFEAAPGSPAAGLTGYEYRLDLSQAYGIVSTPCVDALSLKTGWPTPTLDLDGNGAAGDRLYIVNGPPGSRSPTAAEKWDSIIWFYFENPVCVGSAPGNGDRTLAFGLVSYQFPISSQAKVKVDGGGPGGLLSVETRTPHIGPVEVIPLSKYAETFVQFVPVPGPFPVAERRRSTLMSRFASVQTLAEAGRIRAARLTLERIRSVVDGEGEDWIVDVRGTREDERQIVLSLVDLAIRALAGEVRDDPDQPDR